jgi:ferrous iron transport protein B
MPAKDKRLLTEATIPLRGPLLRGKRRPRVALIGRFGAGKSTIFEGASSPVARHEKLAGVGGAYQECVVDVGLDQISLVDLPSIDSLHHLSEHDQVVLMYLLWGDQWPRVAQHETPPGGPDFPAPDVLVQVVDATTLEKDLELSLELGQFGRPLVIALNRVDEARKRGLFINVQALSERLGAPVIPTIAHMGKGIAALFEAVLDVARKKTCPMPQAPTPHIAASLRELKSVISHPQIEEVFQVPRALLLSQLAENDDYFLRSLTTHFPDLAPQIAQARARAEQTLPRPLPEEVHADRHHRAAVLFEEVTRARGIDSGEGWRRWLDELFLHPRWGLLGSLLVFAAVLLIVFEMSSFIDSWTSARLAAWAQEWQPTSTAGVVGRAVADGMVGLVGIVAPYMLPLVLLLVALEESGVMHRVAFVVDRGFHRIGLHGGVAVPFLIGLGCNVPAISAAAATGTRSERVVSAILITFVPCSARSAIILAIGGKYLGGLGVFAIFALTLFVIALLGKTARAPLQRKRARPRADHPALQVTRLVVHLAQDLGAHRGHRHHRHAAAGDRQRRSGAAQPLRRRCGDQYGLIPVTTWWLGLPVVLGVPILFGVLRKELSLLMIYQALGTLDIMPLLSHAQIFTFLVFLTFYVPCLSTFAVMLKTLGRKEAWFSVFVSLASALLMAGVVRVALEITQHFFGFGA